MPKYPIDDQFWFFIFSVLAFLKIR